MVGVWLLNDKISSVERLCFILFYFILFMTPSRRHRSSSKSDSPLVLAVAGSKHGGARGSTALAGGASVLVGRESFTANRGGSRTSTNVCGVISHPFDDVVFIFLTFS